MCQIIEITGWTEEQYYATSVDFIRKFSDYLEGKAIGLERKARREANRRK